MGKNRNAYKVLMGKLKERGHLEDLSRWRIILNRILKTLLGGHGQ